MRKTAIMQLLIDVDKLRRAKCYVNPQSVLNDIECLLHASLETEKKDIIEAINEHDKKCIDMANSVIKKIKPHCAMLFEYDGKSGEQYYSNTFQK